MQAQWQALYARWTKDNLEEEGVLIRISEAHPVFSLVRGNKDLIGGQAALDAILCDGGTSMHLEGAFFRACCRLLREKCFE